jgi:23S rRNA pseudouridine2605 synthase
LEIVLREGKNREIRRILARLGHKVQTLRRIAIGPLRLGDVPPGAYRLVGKDEVRKLQAAAEASRIESESQTAAAKADRKKSPGASKRSAQRSAYASRSATSPATNRNARAGKKASKRTGKEPELKFNFDGENEPTSGSVIGGDPSEGSDGRKRRSAKDGMRGRKKAAGKRTSSRSSTTKGAGKGTKRAATKRKASKKKAARKKPSASASKPRRGAGRTKKAQAKKARVKKTSSGKGRKRKR